MSDIENRIAQFRKMANDDPDNELGHYRLGQLLMENKQLAEAIKSFERSLELSAQFSKVFEFMGSCPIQQGQGRPLSVPVMTFVPRNSEQFHSLFNVSGKEVCQFIQFEKTNFWGIE